MNEHGSVTMWLQLLRDGDRGTAVERLWQSYFGRLVGLARAHLRARPRPDADEEDVALAAFDSFVRAVEAGRFPDLDDRNDLWQVLFVLTARKSVDLIEKAATQKAGGGRVRHLSAFRTESGSAAEVDAAGREPDPAEAVALAEGLEQMLRVLGDDQLRRVVVWRMEGYGNEEIADKLGRSVATVERKLQTARAILREAGFRTDAPEPGGDAR